LYVHPIVSASLFDSAKLGQQHKKHLTLADHLYYCFGGKNDLYIHQQACAATKLEYSELAKVVVVVSADGTRLKPPSRSTLYRLLKRLSLTNFPCKQHPKLNCTHALKRLQFCRQYRTFKWSQCTLKFSDECSIQKGSGRNRKWVFRYPEER
jgi:hypothetical protein